MEDGLVDRRAEQYPDRRRVRQYELYTTALIGKSIMTRQLLLETATQPKMEISGWWQVSKALRGLDGSIETWVSLEMADDGSLVCGGGNDARYLVVYSADKTPTKRR